MKTVVGTRKDINNSNSQTWDHECLLKFSRKINIFVHQFFAKYEGDWGLVVLVR